MTDHPLPMTPAERSRRYRERRRDGVHLINLEVDEQMVRGLVKLGLIDLAAGKDRDQIEETLTFLVEAIAEDGIQFTDEFMAQF